MNGVPIKRVNQAYTISTSAKVDLKDVDVSKLNDETFKKDKTKVSRSHKFFQKDAPETKVTDDRKKLQKEVDGALVKNIGDAMMKKYLGARFSLTKSDAPHAMKFWAAAVDKLIRW